MTGFPLLRLLLVIAALGLAAIPLARMTARDPVAAEVLPPERSAVNEARPMVDYEITASAPLAGLEITANGQQIHEGMVKSNPLTIRSLAPADVFDVVLRGQWDGQAAPPFALRLLARQGDAVLADQTFWSTGNLVDAVTIRTESK